MRRLLIACLLIASGGAPASAIDVTFTGLVVDTCSLSVPTPGVMMLSPDGEILGSDQLLGVPAELNIISLGANSITVGAPTLESHPPAYVAGSETVEMSYTGLSGLSGISQAYSSSPHSFSVGILPLTVLLINNQIVNPDGFEQGTYTTKTVVTCS